MLGRPREALAALDQKGGEPEGVDPIVLAEHWLVEARALAALHRDTARARSLAQKANATWAEHQRKTGTALYDHAIAEANELLRTLRPLR